MSARHDDVAVRKRLLLAKSALLRAQFQAEVAAVRSRSWIGLPLMGIVALLAGRGASGGAGWIAKAGSLIALARTVLSFVRGLRR